MDRDWFSPSEENVLQAVEGRLCDLRSVASFMKLPDLSEIEE